MVDSVWKVFLTYYALAIELSKAIQAVVFCFRQVVDFES